MNAFIVAILPLLLSELQSSLQYVISPNPTNLIAHKKTRESAYLSSCYFPTFRFPL